jgi:hypothetical protein
MAVECSVGIVKTFIGVSVTVGCSKASTNLKAWSLLAAAVLLLCTDGCCEKKRMFVT